MTYMASWHRVMVDKPCRFSFLYRRWYHLLGYNVRASTASRNGWLVSSLVSEMVDGRSSCLRDGVRYMAARFFAAPIQGRTREVPKDVHGLRLNEAITAKYIRLVTDQGHAVVSREEALDRARRLDLDLVEVQRTAKPPVCKIMDYHKVKFTKEAMEKMRAKTKSETTIRKGDFKEVRLKGKIDQKDIEVKAETVKGLIERGYRVKCMALPSKQRGTEECDLGALLTRLTDLVTTTSLHSLHCHSPVAFLQIELVLDICPLRALDSLVHWLIPRAPWLAMPTYLNTLLFSA